jgi:hypothetical protein
MAGARSDQAGCRSACYFALFVLGPRQIATGMHALPYSADDDLKNRSAEPSPAAGRPPGSQDMTVLSAFGSWTITVE